MNKEYVGHRGLYMALVAVAILAVIAVVLFQKYGSSSITEVWASVFGKSQTYETLVETSTGMNTDSTDLPPYIPPGDMEQNEDVAIDAPETRVYKDDDSILPITESPGLSLRQHDVDPLSEKRGLNEVKPQSKPVEEVAEIIRQHEEVPLSTPYVEAPEKLDTQEINSPASVDMEALEKLEDQLINLSSHASVLNGSIDRLRREQESQGFGLRGDIANAAELLTTNLDRARRALESQDVEKTRTYLKSAQSNVETLERFLGRR